MPPPRFDHIRPIDQSVLEVLQTGPENQSIEGRVNAGMTVPELTEQLDVTPTAVRQRLERLSELALIERSKESVGRGRPQFRYKLTNLGRRFAAASYADLATALWQEITELADAEQRTGMLQRVAKRMGAGLKEAIPVNGSINEKFSAAVVALEKRRVAAALNAEGELPVLEVHCCPYPEIADSEKGRQLCEMEQEMLSEALGEQVHLDRCLLDGHELCQFRPVVDSSPATSP
ncbi:MAG: helix-turn-helix transcriptional regulator [Pirellulaceae bacterium]